uniref:Protein phosphatase 1 regulatory subunit 22 n=1 Tax=Rhabditophanes sp. KR3021 TaxID=114890 RepID=A0AC35TN19_9BILA
MFATAEKVVTGVSTLKSRYYKYLEKLCVSNGIDISQLKNEGSKQDAIEMFFGGFPVLIGLKYFTNLSCLKLINQEIVSLRPINEVSRTLTELWLVEGIIQDITGIETCKKLKKVYLYDNKIEDAKLIGSLTNLECLWIGENKLKSFAFLRHLSSLVELKLNGKQCTDSNLITIDKWSSKLKILDISNNNLVSPQALILSATCETLKSIFVNWDFEEESKMGLSKNLINMFLFQFRYLNSINNQIIPDQQQISLRNQARNELYLALNLALQCQEDYIQAKTNIEKITLSVHEKLSLYVLLLSKAKINAPKKEGRRNIVTKMYEDYLKNLKNIRKTKRLALDFEYKLKSLKQYFISVNKLESANMLTFRFLDSIEIELFTTMLTNHFTFGKSHSLKILFACSLTPEEFVFDNVENLFCISGPNTTNKNVTTWTLTQIIELMDRRGFVKSEITENIQIFKNICKFFSSDDSKKSKYLLVPIVEHIPPSADDKINASIDEDDEAEDMVHWNDMTLKAFLIIEAKLVEDFTIDMVRDSNLFESQITDQMKRIKGMGIDISLNHKKNDQDNEVIAALIYEGKVKKETAKIRKLSDVISQNINQINWNKEIVDSNSKPYTIRKQLEILLNFNEKGLFIDMIDFQTNATLINVPDLRITKLDDLTRFDKLTHLNLSNNSLHSIKKMDCLTNLVYLDVSHNNITVIEDLPENLNVFNISFNNIKSIESIAKLILLIHLDMASNSIKSLKGLENSIVLETLLGSHNIIADKSELDLFDSFHKLAYIDLSNNPVTLIDGYRKKIILANKSLYALDREIIQKTEFKNSLQKSGKILDIQLITTSAPNFKTSNTLNLEHLQIQAIVLNNDAIDDLFHVSKLNLSGNKLTAINPLLNLKNLVELNLSENFISTLAIENKITTSTFLNLPNLEVLKLPKNNISSNTIVRLNLKMFNKLKELDLSGNNLVKFDFGLLADLHHLQKLYLQNNQIKQLVRKNLQSLIWLNLSGNKLKDIDQTAFVELQHLDVSNNKISTCSALKAISRMPKLTYLDCRNNSVCGRRVYSDFIKNQSKSLRILDTLDINNIPIALGPVKTSKELPTIDQIMPARLMANTKQKTNINFLDSLDKFKDDFSAESTSLWDVNDIQIVKPNLKNLRAIKHTGKKIVSSDYFYGLDDTTKVDQDFMLKGIKIKTKMSGR